MFQTFLIMLREGVEASLVVGILVGYLVRSGHRDRLQAVWIGVAAAAALSLGAGFVLMVITDNLDTHQLQEAFGGVMSIVAVGFVTWMVFWMRSQSHTLKGELTGQMENAVGMGPVAIGLCGFFAVAREGLETALFLWPTFKSAGSGAGPTIGALLGLVAAVLIGVLVYRGAVKLNLGTFFRVTGAALVVIASGVLAYGVHDLQEAGYLGGGQHVAFDISAQMPPSSWYGTLVKGIFNISPKMSWLEVAAYFGYLIPTMYLFLRPVRRKSPTPSGPSASAPPEPTAEQTAELAAEPAAEPSAESSAAVESTAAV